MFERKSGLQRPVSARGDGQAFELPSSRPHRPLSASKSTSLNTIAGKIRIYGNSNDRDPAQLARLRPKLIPQDKERLYEDTLYLKMQNNSLRDENVRLKTRLAQMETETDDRGSSTLLSGLRQTIKELRLYVKKKDEEVALLKRNMKNSRVKELEVELHTYQEECGRLTKLVADGKLHQHAQLRHDDLEERLRLELSSNANLRQEVKQLSAVLQDTREQHEHDQQFIQQLERKLKPKKSQEQIQMLTMEVQRLRTQLTEAESVSSQLEARLREKSEALAKAEEACSQKQGEIAALDISLGGKQEAVKTLEAQLQSVRKSMNSATRTIRDLEQTKAGLEDQASSLAKDLAARQADLQIARNEKAALIQAHTETLETKQEAWDIEKAQLETDLADRQQELETAQTTIRQKDSEFEAKTRDYEAALAALNRQIGDLQVLSETLLRRAEDSESRENQLNSQLNQLQTRLETYESIEQSLQASLQTSAREKEELSRQVAKSQEELTSTRHRLSKEQTSATEMMEMFREEQQQREGLRRRVVKAVGKKTANARKHCEDIPALLQDLDEDKTGFAQVKPVKKALKKLHLKKFAFKVVRALVETRPGELDLRELQKVLQLASPSDSSASSRSATPRASEVVELQPEVHTRQEEMPLDRVEAIPLDRMEETNMGQEEAKQEEMPKEDFEPDIETQGRQENTEFPPSFPAKAETPTSPEKSYSSDHFSFEEVKEELTPPHPPASSTPESESLLASLHSLLRHLSFRLQLHRFTAQHLAKQLSSNESSVSCSALRLHFSQPPLAITDPRDQQLLLLVCLEQPIAEANMERSWEGSVEVENVMRVLLERIGTWEVFEKRDEDEMDRRITTAAGYKGEQFKACCQQIDRDSLEYISYSDFLLVLQELDISFDTKCLRYLQLLFYSFDQQLDRVPYTSFLDVYCSTEPDPSLDYPPTNSVPPQLTEEQRDSLIRQHVTTIAASLGSRQLSEIFATSADRLIFPPQFREGLRKLRIEMAEDTLEMVITGLQYEASPQPCISLVELEEIVAKLRPEQTSEAESDQSELEYVGEDEEDDRM